MGRLLVEDCARLEINLLFKTGRVGAGSTTWRGCRWKIDGAFFVTSERTWRLVPTPRKNVRGVQWLLLDATGRRCTCLFITPDGTVGTRWELQLRYRSQRLWTRKKQRAWRRQKIIEKLNGPTDFQWVVNHEDFVPALAIMALRSADATAPKAQGPIIRQFTLIKGGRDD
jgi:hypothetical protein